MSVRVRGLLVAVFCTILMACGGEELTSAEHMEKAKVLLETADERGAIIELKNALQKDVNSSRARTLLGKTYFSQGDYQGAEKELTRALESGVDATGVMPVLAQTLLSLGELAKLENLPVDALDPEGRSLVQAAKGLGRLFKADLTAAEEMIGAAMENDPRSPYAEVAQARLSMAQEKYPQARNQLKAIFKDNPKYDPAWNLLGDIEAAQKKPKAAEKAYTQVLLVAPRSFDARLNRAMMRIYQNNFKGAQEDLQRLSKTHGGPAQIHPGVNFALGITHLHFKRYKPAKVAFEKSSQYSEAYPLSHYYLAAIDMESGNHEQALSHVYRFLAILPGSVVGAKLAAKLELNQQGFAAAVQLLEPLVSEYPEDIDALNMLASAYLATDKGSEGVALLAKVAQLQPESTEAKARLGAGFLAAGNEKLGIATLEGLLTTDPAYEQADILIVLNHLRTRNTEAAVEAAEAYQQRNPESTTSFNLLGRAYLAAGRTDAARKAFQEAVNLRPDDPGGNISLAEFKLADKKFDAARNHYERVLKKNPDHMQTLMKVAASYALEGREKEMFASLEKTIESHPRAMEPHLIKARYFIAKGDLDKAKAEFNTLTSEQKEHPDALVTLAGLELASNEYNRAHHTLEELIRLRPNVSQYHYMRAKALAGAGDLENFTRALERSVELDPDHFYAKLALARLSLMTGSTPKFNELLEGLRKTAPENPDVMKLEVASADMRGDDEYAGELLRKLYKDSPTISNAIPLASHYEKQGDAKTAIVLLKKWSAEHGDNVQVHAKLAQLYGNKDDIDGAIGEYKAILAKDNDNLVALNNLAWYLLEVDADEALGFAERAFGLSPESSSVLDTLAMAQLKTGRLVEARRTIDRALAETPDSPDLQFHEAQIRAQEGDRPGAIERLTRLVAEHEDFFERKKAAAYLKYLQGQEAQ